MDVTLPVSLQYQSSVSCNALPILQGPLGTQLETVLTELNMCRKHCDVLEIEVDCEEQDSAPYQSLITFSFKILVKNPDDNAVSPSCDGGCKRNNMREMLRETFNVKSEIEKLVKANADQLQLDSHLPNTHLVTSSFTSGSPQLLCEAGKVYTKNRLCGWYNSHPFAT